jgi:NitT/TauT family transport system ATP-binding protein
MLRPLLEVDTVTLQYPTEDHLITATWRASFHVFPSDRFVLLGPSGCGKSSLLKAVGGFMAPVEGQIRLKNTEVTRPGPDRMMVFQEFDQLLRWKSVLENVKYPMKVSGRFPKSEIEGRALASLAAANLEKFADVYPHMLSGGMKQRVAIARAIAMEPALLLMDEPFAALDGLTRRTMQKEVLRLWDETGVTILFVTHSIEEAMVVGSRILVLSPHPGQVRAEIDVSDLGFDDIGTERFGELHRHIEGLLFEHQSGVS